MMNAKLNWFHLTIYASLMLLLVGLIGTEVYDHFEREAIIESLKVEKENLSARNEVPTGYLADGYLVNVGTVHDADTFKHCTIDLGFGVLLDDQDLRMADFDAWEVSKGRHTVKVTDQEVAFGKQVTEKVKDAVSKAARITAEPHHPFRDVYGRLLVTIKLDGKPLREIVEAADGIRDNRFNQE